MGDDWDSRVLCSDGNCIGVIGPDGRCKECGKPSDEPLPPQTAKAAEQDAPTVDAATETVEEGRLSPPSFEEAATPAEENKDDDWDNRVLCSDGSCIGVIGPDGKCKECGRPCGKAPETASDAPGSSV
jgi:hypothetical protein